MQLHVRPQSMVCNDIVLLISMLQRHSPLPGHPMEPLDYPSLRLPIERLAETVDDKAEGRLLVIVRAKGAHACGKIGVQLHHQGFIARNIPATCVMLKNSANKKGPPRHLPHPNAVKKCYGSAWKQRSAIAALTFLQFSSHSLADWANMSTRR
jgi:hypothetical protein